MAIAIPRFQSANVPKQDGETLLFIPPGIEDSRSFQRSQRVIFVNDSAAAGRQHVATALGLAELCMCPVLGIHNASGSTAIDVVTHLAASFQLPDSDTKSARDAIASAVRAAHAAGHRTATPLSVLESALASCRASLAAFRQLATRGSESFEVYAIGDGNRIVCNALDAMAAGSLVGAGADRIVNTCASNVAPGDWPPGVELRELPGGMDTVTWLGSPDWAATWTDVGLPADASPLGTAFADWIAARAPASDTFLRFQAEDPLFVVNRFRRAAHGASGAVDATSLAAALANPAVSLERVRGVLEYLRRRHRRDADDVAMAYIATLRDPARGLADLATAARRDTALRTLLADLLRAGRISSDEERAIAWLEEPVGS
ncbi:MAG: hypothetical protein IPM29_09905 [Planctomycetes bacterium]|nr:hypothetical protein [Planctomycetota bacterium]